MSSNEPKRTTIHSPLETTINTRWNHRTVMHFSWSMSTPRGRVSANVDYKLMAVHLRLSLPPIDPIKGVTMNTTDIEKTHHYWHTLLNLKTLAKTETDLRLTYSDTQAYLAFKKIGMLNITVGGQSWKSNFRLFFSFLRRTNWSKEGLRPHCVRRSVRRSSWDQSNHKWKQANHFDATHHIGHTWQSDRPRDYSVRSERVGDLLRRRRGLFAIVAGRSTEWRRSR